MKCNRCIGGVVLYDGIEPCCINCGHRPIGYNSQVVHSGERVVHVELNYTTEMPEQKWGYSTGGVDLQWTHVYNGKAGPVLVGSHIKGRPGYPMGPEGVAT